MLLNCVGLPIIPTIDGLPSRLANAAGLPDCSKEIDCVPSSEESWFWLLSIPVSDGLPIRPASWFGSDVMLVNVEPLMKESSCAGFELIPERDGFESRFVMMSGLLLAAPVRLGRESTDASPAGFCIMVPREGFESSDANCVGLETTGLSDWVERKVPNCVGLPNIVEKEGLFMSVENCAGLLITDVIWPVDMIVAKFAGFAAILTSEGLPRSACSDCWFESNGIRVGFDITVPRPAGFDITPGNDGFESRLANAEGLPIIPESWLVPAKLAKAVGLLLIAESDGLERSVLSSDGLEIMPARLPCDVSVTRPLGLALMVARDGFESRLASWFGFEIICESAGFDIIALNCCGLPSMLGSDGFWMNAPNEGLLSIEANCGFCVSVLYAPLVTKVPNEGVDISIVSDGLDIMLENCDGLLMSAESCEFVTNAVSWLGDICEITGLLREPTRAVGFCETIPNPWLDIRELNPDWLFIMAVSAGFESRLARFP